MMNILSNGENPLYVNPNDVIAVIFNNGGNEQSKSATVYLRGKLQFTVSKKDAQQLIDSINKNPVLKKEE